MSEAVDRANKLVESIYEKINIIENGEMMLKTMDTVNGIYLGKDDEVFKIENSMLSVDQQAEIMYAIRDMILGNMDDAERVLDRMSGASEEATIPAFEPKEEVKEVKEEVKEEVKPLEMPEKPKKVKHVLTDDDIPVIKEKFTNGEFTLTQMAAELGCTKSELKKFTETNHLVKKEW